MVEKAITSRKTTKNMLDKSLTNTQPISTAWALIKLLYSKSARVKLIKAPKRLPKKPMTKKTVQDITLNIPDSMEAEETLGKTKKAAINKTSRPISRFFLPKIFLPIFFIDIISVK